MTVKEAAGKLHVHPTALSKMCAENKVDAEKRTGAWNISEEEVNRFLLTRYEHQEDWIDTAQVARILKKSPKIIRKLVQQGRFGGQYDPLCRTQKLWISKKDLMLTIQEAAELLHLHPAALSKILAEGGTIQGKKVKGQWRIPSEEVERYQKVRYEYDSNWIDVKEVARILRTSPKAVRSMIDRKEIQAEIDPLCGTQKFWIHRLKLEPMKRILINRKSNRW